jgi:hypothetical protein
MLLLIFYFTLLKNFHYLLNLNLISVNFLNLLRTYLNLIVKLITVIKIKITLSLTTGSKHLIIQKKFYFH